jgi:sugar O-acyltransferase (sialic acid O-acetyltransferase NeuD family)
MIIVGSKGFAKELLEVAHQLGSTDRLVFFDNVSSDLPDQLYGQFPILRSEEEVKAYFQLNGNSFALGLGGPQKRKEMCALFESWGGELTSLISPKANIGSFGVEIGQGATILAQAIITNEVKCGRGLLMYPNSIITHDCILGDFVELSAVATILGGVIIGSETHIGANATVLPQLKIGSKATVGAGAVVTKDVNEGQTVKGIPAR